MAKVMKIEDVFSPSKLEQIKSLVRIVMKERYGEKIDTCEIAFGNMVNGISLVYLGQLQQDIDNVERVCYAQLAINHNGDFIDVFTDEKKQKFFGYETYDEKEDVTFLQFRLARLFNVISSSDLVSTEDFNNWKYNPDATSISEYFICDYEVYPGNVKPQTVEIRFFIESGDEELNDDAYDYYDDLLFEGEEETSIYSDLITRNTYLCRSWGWNKQMFDYKRLSISCYSRFIIKDLYLLLVDNLRSYFSDEDFESIEPYITPYRALFERYKIMDDDAYDNRYGIYDISQKKVIIHAGEMQLSCALISGFRRIDFYYSSILTYDFLDILAEEGMHYSKHLSGINNPSIVSSSCLRGGQVWVKARFSVTDYWSNPKSRTGLNAGEWFIIREGEHAGRTLCWLLANGFAQDVIKMIDIGYLSFNNFNHFHYPSSIDQKSRDEIWLALDKQQKFHDITSISDCLELEFPFSQHWIAKHDAIALDTWGEPPSFEELVYDDTDYLVGLIDKRSLYVKQNVMNELKDCYEGNKKYLLKLKKVQDALDDYNEDIQHMHDLEEARWEESNQDWYDNEGYRGAFEDDPEAEWNID